jgi:Lrp/AsnC family leucine-responsive transcriptional regulator
VLDKKDREIIDLLRNDARLSYRELGEAICLSANTVADRVRRLQADGILLGYFAQVDLAKLDLSVHAYIDVKLLPATTAADFDATIQVIPGIIESCLLTGSYDYQLRVACKDHADFVRLVESLRARAGVQDTHSRMILSRMIVRGKLGVI